MSLDEQILAKPIGSGVWEKPNSRGISHTHRIIAFCIGLACFLPVMNLSWFPISIVPMWFFIFGYRCFSLWCQSDPFNLDVRQEYKSLPDILEAGEKYLDGI